MIEKYGVPDSPIISFEVCNHAGRRYVRRVKILFAKPHSPAPILQGIAIPGGFLQSIYTDEITAVITDDGEVVSPGPTVNELLRAAGLRPQSFDTGSQFISLGNEFLGVRKILIATAVILAVTLAILIVDGWYLIGLTTVALMAPLGIGAAVLTKLLRRMGY
ncbi:hypothetical protein CBW24_07820 [Pacificitalea manganoxidans]|uniref:Uncharacterized protein n=1 Tax=Pacificitalea manganoxidans TaxID=1411902 RepID=A0A291LZ61_9RHOB|nr:hypothetical protein [Pacificitalea manganoxidans]ATI41917.1 hypothetical protein CBW24_07820 [Pacificitalea manganoxidans]MDR6309403.1 hypothetical protein [Pacificitalea manganoxidans]